MLLQKSANDKKIQYGLKVQISSSVLNSKEVSIEDVYLN